jgi:hypothetical protein
MARSRGLGDVYKRQGKGSEGNVNTSGVTGSERERNVLRFGCRVGERVEGKGFVRVGRIQSGAVLESHSAFKIGCIGSAVLHGVGTFEVQGKQGKKQDCRHAQIGIFHCCEFESLN